MNNSRPGVPSEVFCRSPVGTQKGWLIMSGEAALRLASMKSATQSHGDSDSAVKGTDHDASKFKISAVRL